MFPKRIFLGILVTVLLIGLGACKDKMTDDKKPVVKTPAQMLLGYWISQRNTANGKEVTCGDTYIKTGGGDALFDASFELELFTTGANKYLDCTGVQKAYTSWLVQGSEFFLATDVAEVYSLISLSDSTLVLEERNSGNIFRHEFVKDK